MESVIFSHYVHQKTLIHLPKLHQLHLLAIMHHQVHFQLQLLPIQDCFYYRRLPAYLQPSNLRYLLSLLLFAASYLGQHTLLLKSMYFHLLQASFPE